MNRGIDGGTVERGDEITLTQRSSRRREYEMRAGDQALGWLQWPRGRRSVAQAEGRGVGLMKLTTRRGRVVVVGGEDGADTLGTVERERGGSVINAVEGRALRWERTARSNRWAIHDQGEPLLSVAASRGLLRSSVRISVERTMPEETAVLLCLIGGYLALSELQSMVDGSAAVGGIVATGAG